MNAPQILLIAWYALGLGILTAKHGQPKEGKHSFWTGLAGLMIVFGLLWWGGFFSG